MILYLLENETKIPELKCVYFICFVINGKQICDYLKWLMKLSRHLFGITGGSNKGQANLIQISTNTIV